MYINYKMIQRKISSMMDFIVKQFKEKVLHDGIIIEQRHVISKNVAF